MNDKGLAEEEKPLQHPTPQSITVSSNSQKFGDTVGPVVLTFQVTGTNPTLTVAPVAHSCFQLNLSQLWFNGGIGWVRDIR